MSRAITLEEAKKNYPHRYTMEHVPSWAREGQPTPDKYYAPQYASDQEWYDNTIFPGEVEHFGGKECISIGQTWPLGKLLDEPYQIQK